MQCSFCKREEPLAIHTAPRLAVNLGKNNASLAVQISVEVQPAICDHCVLTALAVVTQQVREYAQKNDDEAHYGEFLDGARDALKK